MCRFVAYAGPPIKLSELLYEPEHSIIHQSVHAHEREEPLNGDGWGVSWYDLDVREQPGVYRTLHPAWSDDNMRHIAPMIEPTVFFAHVRAASPGLPVQRLNCHPFQGGRHTHEVSDELEPVEDSRRRLSFMHNGGVGGFSKLKRSLLNRLPDPIYQGIQGTTDSEHVFGLIQKSLGEDAVDPEPADLAEAVRGGLTELIEIEEEAGVFDEGTNLNVALTDGRSLVAMRYAHASDDDPPTLYVGQAGGFFCEASGRLTARDPEDDKATLIASESLWGDDRVWSRIEPNHLAVVTSDGDVTMEPVDVQA